MKKQHAKIPLIISEYMSKIENKISKNSKIIDFIKYI